MAMVRQEVCDPDNYELNCYRRHLVHLIAHIPDPHTLWVTVQFLEECFRSQHWALPTVLLRETLVLQLPPCD